MFVSWRIFRRWFGGNISIKIFQLTNTKLEKVLHKEKNWQEILKFFGILVLMTRFEFESRASLWSTFSLSKYVPVDHFGKTGMFRPRFDFLFRCIRFSDQPNRRPAGMLAVVYWWKLVDELEDLYVDVSAKPSPKDLPTNKDTISMS